MSGLSVVIPSRNFQNLHACIRALHLYGSGRIIVVDDGLAETGYQPGSSEYDRGACLDGATIVPGQKPFIFARNVNIGIEAAGDDDVILLNDDALLETPGGFRALHNQALRHTEFGLIAASCNNVGNVNQYRRGTDGLREEPRMVCFVCVLIPRRTIERVGLLDERFTGYGCDDDDFCLRVRQAGLKIGIFDGCYVDHGSLTSTFRGMPGAGGDYRGNLELFKAKWGRDNWGNVA